MWTGHERLPKQASARCHDPVRSGLRGHCRKKQRHVALRLRAAPQQAPHAGMEIRRNRSTGRQHRLEEKGPLRPTLTRRRIVVTRQPGVVELPRQRHRGSASADPYPTGRTRSRLERSSRGSFRKAGPGPAVLRFVGGLSVRCRGNPEGTSRIGLQKEGAGGQDKRGIIVASEIEQSRSFASAAQRRRASRTDELAGIKARLRQLHQPAHLSSRSRPKTGHSQSQSPARREEFHPPRDPLPNAFHRPLLGTTKREAGCNLETRPS